MFFKKHITNFLRFYKEPEKNKKASPQWYKLRGCFLQRKEIGKIGMKK